MPASNSLVPLSLSLPLLAYKVCVVGKLAAAHTQPSLTALGNLGTPGHSDGSWMCSHNWALPHPAVQTRACIPLSGWDLCLLVQEAVTQAATAQGTDAPLPQCQGAQILLWLPLPWPTWSCETRQGGRQCSSMPCCPAGPAAR